MRILPHELANFFQLLGQATFYVQHVENSLHHLLALSQFEGPNSVSSEEAVAVLDRFQRKTLGGLIGYLEKHGGFGLPMDELRLLNAERKWMIHQILKDEQYRLTNDSTFRSTVFHRLDRFVDEAQRLNKAVGEAVMALTISKGVSRQTIAAALERELRKI